MSSPPACRTLGTLLRDLAVTRSDCEALVGGGKRLSYGQLWRETERLARGMMALGIGRGDRVACWAPNQVEWVVTNMAVTSIGAVLVAVNTWYRSHELRYLLRHAGAKAIVVTDSFDRHDCYEVLTSVVPELESLAPGSPVRSAEFPDLRWVITIEDHVRRGALTMSEVARRGAAVPDGRFARELAAVRPSQAADLLYTSGSTAEPKGVVLVHGHLIENGFHIGERLRVTAADRIWLANPLFFSYGCANALMVSLAHGAALVLQRVFEPGEGLRLLEQERCSVLYGSTNMVLALLSHPDRPHRDLSALRKGTGIGTPAELRARLQLGVTGICNAYGLTETYGHCCESDAEEPERVRLTASGRPLPGNEVRIVDPESGQELGPEVTGEIVVRGRVTPGYYNDPERNSMAFAPGGFLRTGDLGFLDKAGRIHWQARLTEMIKTGGINVAPSEVEQVLGEHPSVNAVCVVALPHPTLGEEVAAAIRPNPGTDTGPDELRAFCRARMASYKAPRKFFILDSEEFPLTPTGKVWRKELQRRLVDNQEPFTREEI